MKIRLVGADLLRVGEETHGRTDRQTKVIVDLAVLPTRPNILHYAHTVYFVQISDQTTIISVVYIILTQCVFCALDH